MRALLTLTVSDLRQRIRDRSVILFALVVPLALMGVFNLVFGTAAELDLGPTTVAVSAPAGDPLAGVLTEVIAGLDEADAGFTVTLLEVSATEVEDAVTAGRAALGLVIPEDFTMALAAGEGPTIEAIEAASTLETGIVITVVNSTLTRLQSDAVTIRAAADAGLSPEQVAQIAQEGTSARPAYSLRPGTAAAQQLSPAAALVAGQTGLFLLFTVSFGVLGLIEERANGTLARLRSLPMPSWLIVAAKALVSVILGIVATTVLLLTGGWMFEVGFGSPVAVAALVVSVVLAATSVMFLVVRVATTAEQANVAASITALVLGIAGGAFFPVSASGLLGVLLDLNPVAAFIRGLGITAGGGGLTDIGVPVAIMAGFAVVTVAVSSVLPDRGVTS